MEQSGENQAKAEALAALDRNNLLSDRSNILVCTLAAGAMELVRTDRGQKESETRKRYSVNDESAERRDSGDERRKLSDPAKRDRHQENIQLRQRNLSEISGEVTHATETPLEKELLKSVESLVNEVRQNMEQLHVFHEAQSEIVQALSRRA